MLSTMRLEPTSRQRLQLLLQRQHIEEEELRLRHFMELEKFRERKYSKLNVKLNIIHKLRFIFRLQKLQTMIKKRIDVKNKKNCK